MLVYEEADRPVAGAGKVVVTVTGTAFNPVDIAIRAGFMQQVFPSAESLSDNELLTKLRILGVDADRAGLERLWENALSAEEVALPMLEKLGLGDDVASDWVWICLLALWQRWWPDRVCMDLLDDKMQADYSQDAENDTHGATATWLKAWSDVLRLCDATGISSMRSSTTAFP